MAEEIGGIDSRSLAEATAAAVANNPPEATPVIEVPGEDLTPQVAEIEAGEAPAVETPPVEEAPVIETPPVEVTPPVEAPTFDELTMELARVGIDLGVNRGELPAEVQPIYDRLAQQALMQAQSLASEKSQLAESQAEIKQFAQKLQDDPQSVLLTMAVTNPEAFQSTVEAYERMSEDEFYRATVIKDLQADAKVAAARRQSQIFEERQMRQKVAQVEHATHIAADAYGIDRSLAEEFVAAAITRGGGDIDISQVSSVVARLAPTGKRITPQEKVARTATAPPATVQGTGQPVGSADSADTEISPGLTKASRNPFLELIRGASNRLGTPKE